MNTNPKIIFIITLGLVLVVFAGMVGTYSLIINKADAALIAIISGHTGTALGGLLSMLNNTRTSVTPPSPDPAPVKITNPASDPAHVTTDN